MATLGIVEFFLYLLSDYHPNYDKGKKGVFADVHFLFFFTAIFNALQTVLTAFVTTSVSKRMWVETEMLELNHYVEIREEFQRVKQELDRLNNRSSSDVFSGSSTSQVPSSSDRLAVDALEDETEQISNERAAVDQEIGVKRKKNRQISFERAFEFNRRSVSDVWRGLMDRIRHPRLWCKYNDLLVQVRFHELRVVCSRKWKCWCPVDLFLTSFSILRTFCKLSACR